MENLAMVADAGCRYQRLCRKVIAVNQGVVFIGGGERVTLPFVVGVVRAAATESGNNWGFSGGRVEDLVDQVFTYSDEVIFIV